MSQSPTPCLSPLASSKACFGLILMATPAISHYDPSLTELSPFASEIFLPYGAWMVRALAAVARGFGGSVGGAGAVRTTADLGCSGPRF